MINKNNNQCETKLCYESAIRTRFYNGMLLTDQHLREEQQYHREKLKRANRHLFGSGIVCGLKVKSPDVGLCVKIEPGVALDCCGNLIEVCKCITLDLSKQCKEQYGQGCVQPNSQDAAAAFIIKRYLVLRYVETESDPEPVLTPAADCKSAGEESKCQKSKVREGYCIELWERCPCVESEAAPAGNGNGSDLTKPSPPLPEQPNLDTGEAKQAVIESKSWVDSLEEYLDKYPMPCSPCGCCENAVGLAYLTIDCARSTVKVENTCRSYVITPRLIQWLVSNEFRRSGMPSMLGSSLGYMSAPGAEPGQSKGKAQAETGGTKTTTKKSAASKKGATSVKSQTEAESQLPTAEELKK